MKATASTRGSTMQRRNIFQRSLVVAVTTLLLSGCATTDSRLLPPPSEQMRSHMLSVMVGSSNANPEIVLNGPAKGALEAAWRGARLGVATTLGAASTVAVSGTKDSALAAAAILAMVPIGALLGAGIGAVAAESSAKILEQEAVIRQILAESQAREHLRDCLEAAVRDQVPHVSLAPSSDEHPDTILEIAVERFGLTGDTMVVNPPLQFVMSQRARIIRASDGCELHAQALTWRGQLRPLEQWTVEDGTPVKEAVRQACRDIAEALVDELFLVYQPTGKH